MWKCAKSVCRRPHQCTQTHLATPTKQLIRRQGDIEHFLSIIHAWCMSFSQCDVLANAGVTSDTVGIDSSSHTAHRQARLQVHRLQCLQVWAGKEWIQLNGDEMGPIARDFPRKQCFRVVYPLPGTLTVVKVLAWVLVILLTGLMEGEDEESGWQLLQYHSHHLEWKVGTSIHALNKDNHKMTKKKLTNYWWNVCIVIA